MRHVNYGEEMKHDEPSQADLAPYAGRWVALVRGRVTGVGWTADEARRAAKQNRPKEEPRIIFVPVVEVTDDAEDQSPLA
jgi:hypothetical protein